MERGKELDVRVLGVDGPGCPLTSLVLLNSCQSRSHPVRGLSHWEALPGHLHHHQPQPGGGDAVRVAGRPPVSLLPPGELRQFCLSHYPNTARHLLGSTGDFPCTGATFQCPPADADSARHGALFGQGSPPHQKVSLLWEVVSSLPVLPWLIPVWLALCCRWDTSMLAALRTSQ